MAAYSPSRQSAERLETSFHDNTVTLKCASITKVEWIPGALKISQGQGSGEDPTVKQNGDEWEINLFCGRHKTAEVAADFNALNQSQDHMWNPSSTFDSSPSELNFYLGVGVELLISGMPQFVTLYFAQGSSGSGNNWWIASPALIAKSAFPRVLPIVASSGQVLQILGITSGAANAFELAPWFDRTKAPDEKRDWLKGVNSTLKIGQINLPGTHDSAAIMGFTTYNPWVCHETSLIAQMNAGVRLLDIRLKVKKNNDNIFYFVTCHNDWRLAVNANEFQSFVSALEEIKHFVETNSSEFVVVSLKIDDWNGYETQEQAVLNALSVVLSAYQSVLLISKNLPTVGAARGKVFLLNRINGALTFGAEFQIPDNPRGVLLGPSLTRGFTYWVQDWFRDLPADFERAKFEVWQSGLGQPSTVDVVFNFATAVHNVWAKVDIIGWILEYFGRSPASERPSRIGWVLFDFETTLYMASPYRQLNIVDVIIDSNFGWRNCKDKFYVDNTDKTQP